MQLKKAWQTLISKSNEQLSKSLPNYPIMPFVFGSAKFSLSITGSQAYSNKIFYSATNILVNKLTEPPIMFSKKKSDSSGRKFQKFYSKSISNEKRAVVKALNLVEVENHELNKLFDNPNSYESGIEMMQDFWHQYTFGDGYLYFEPLGDVLSRNKKPIAIHSLSRSRVEPIQSTDSYDNIAYYQYTAWNGTQIKIDKEHILHLKHWNPNISDLKGLGVDEVAAIDINLNRQNNIMQGSAFANGGRGTLFSSDSEITSEGEKVSKMTGEQMAALKETIMRDYAGAENYKKLHFTNGLVNAQNFGDTLIESDAIKAEDSNWKNIYTTVGVPWALSPAASSVSENSIIVGFKSLVTNVAIPELRKFDQKLNKTVQQWWPDIVACHDLTEYSELAPDLKLMKEVYGQPLLTIDEQRSVFGWDSVKDKKQGATIMVQSGLMSLDDILDPELEVDNSAESL